MVGGVIMVALGSSPPLLWLLLPVAISWPVGSAAVSFAAGQAGFTVAL